MSDSDVLKPDYKVPKLTVLMWTVPWVALLVGLLIVSSFTNVRISYAVYTYARRCGAVVLVVLAIVGILRALDLVGKKDDRPWYTDGYLVALVLFWGLGPPTWFFTEYYLIDQRTLALPDELQLRFAAATDDKVRAEILAAYLAATKTYADMAAKIWVAVGAALVTTIGLVKR
jgi:hypothetical protein